MDIFFYLFFLVVFGMVICGIVNSAIQRSKNNNSPRLTVDAKVVSKREEVIWANNPNPYVAGTTYYATFEVESGDRLELTLRASDYKPLSEGGEGKLTFQGTRFLSFERIR